MNDVSSQTHDTLDSEAVSNPMFLRASVDEDGASILNILLVGSNVVAAYANIWPFDVTKTSTVACTNLLAS